MLELKEMLKEDKKALKKLEKLDKKLCDILWLLYGVEDKLDYKCKDLSKAINILQKL